jgi:hypothetical protein
VVTRGPVWEPVRESVRGANKRYSQDCLDVVRVGPAGRAGADGAHAFVLCVADGHGASRHRRSHLGALWAVQEFVHCATPFAERVARHESEPSALRGLAEEAGWLGRTVCHRWRERVLMFEANSPSDGTDPRRGRAPEDGAQLIPYGSTVLGAVVSDRLLFTWQLGDGDIALIGEDGAYWHGESGGDVLGDETESLCGPEPWRSVRAHWQRLSPYGERRLVALSTDGLAKSFADQNGYRAFAEGVYRSVVRHDAPWVRERLPDWLRKAAAHSGDDTTLAGVYHAGERP